MADKTLERLENLEAKMQALEDELEVDLTTTPTGPDEVVRTDRPGPGGGWLVVAPNEGYFGKTCGVSFRAGYAAVPVDMPRADKIVNQLAGDFGYRVKAVGQSEFNNALLAISQVKEPEQADPFNALMNPSRQK